MECSKYKLFTSFFIIIILCSCKIKKADASTDFNKKNNSINQCKLIETDFEVDVKSFKDFHIELEDFNFKKYKYDIVKVFVKGGDNDKSELTRFYYDDNKWNRVNIKKGLKKTALLKNDSSYPQSKVKLLNKLTSFIQTCPYSSNNDTYLILVNVNGDEKFKYNSTSEYYNALSDADKLRINNVTEFLTTLEELNLE